LGRGLLGIGQAPLGLGDPGLQPGEFRLQGLPVTNVLAAGAFQVRKQRPELGELIAEPPGMLFEVAQPQPGFS